MNIKASVMMSMLVRQMKMEKQSVLLIWNSIQGECRGRPLAG
ncbi:hypothetical protein SAMN05720489_0107 [Fibrobacter sp. UWB13]|nr:hypothetical protein SAMN05720489_0107 [Fibrobacter sp. UWB13]